MSREDWENEQARLELERLRISRARDEDERRKEREYRDEYELANAKRELDEIKRRETRAEEEKRIKKELELKRLKEEEEAEAEKKRRDEEARLAVERYKQQEADRAKREMEERQRAEESYKRRLRDDLAKSGLDEKSIDAIMKGQKMPEAAKPKDQQVAARPTYTRMRRQHLSIETLRTFRIDYDLEAVSSYHIATSSPIWFFFADRTTGSRFHFDQALGAGVGARSAVEAHQNHSRETQQQW
jgi:hypothetical protein